MIPGVCRYKPEQFGPPGRMFTTLHPADADNDVPQMHVAQVSIATSQRGTIRGIHYTAKPGQVKHVTCVKGAVWDAVVDLRRGSPTFGKWEFYLLNEKSLACLHIPVGVGHGYCASSDATLLYLLSRTYNKSLEREIHPLDPDLGIRWPTQASMVDLSKRDAHAPLLREAVDLPEWEQ